MEYIEIKLYAEKEDADMLTAALEERIPGGFSMEDPDDFEELMKKEHSYDWDYVSENVKPENSDRVIFTVWIEDSPEGLDTMDAVLSDAAYCGVTESSVANRSDDEWKDKWKAYFKPKKVGRTIVVKPTWETYEPEPGDRIIAIDPGQAFGTGTHETTSLCIRALEDWLPKAAEENGIGADEVAVLDVGCGSGILSMAADLLGARDILGVDIDPIAVEVSKENAALNGMNIRFQEGDLTKGIDFRAHIVVANLMADLVILLSKDVKKHILPGGYYISSGILVEKKELVRKAVEEAGFTVLEAPEDGEWCCVVAKADAVFGAER